MSFQSTKPDIWAQATRAKAWAGAGVGAPPRLHDIGEAGPRIGQRDFLWPLLVIGSLTLLVLTMGVHFSVQAFDRENEVREQSLARGGIAQRLSEVALLAIPQTMWDEAVVHLDTRFDRNWAEANIGRYLAQTAGFDRSFILSAAGQPLYGSIGGSTVLPARFADLARQAAPLVQDVRRLEVRRGPLRKGAVNTMVARPIQKSALDIVDGGLVVMTATLVQSDFGTALPRPIGAPIVVTTMKIDPAFLGLLARRYQLDRLHLLRVGEPGLPGEIRIALSGYRGQRIADLAWQPLDPGYQMLRHSLPPIVAVGAAMFVIALMLLRRLQRLAAQLICAQESLSEMALFDRVSSLPNEARFLAVLAARIGQANAAHPVAVHLVEIPELREVQSAFKPAIADEIVQASSFALQGKCGQESFVARLSDARYGIVTSAMTNVQAKGFAARLCAPLALSLFDGMAMTLDCRADYVVIADRAATAFDALHEAEAKLFETSVSGG